MAQKKQTACPHCQPRKKERDEQEKKDLLTRLKRIEGQIRGIEKMLENDAYCPDIITQVSAANSALNSFKTLMISKHMHSCVASDIRNGKDETIDEFCDVLKKIMK